MTMNVQKVGEKCKICSKFKIDRKAEFYKCPHCDVRTCSILCENIHREQECVLNSEKLKHCEVCKTKEAKYTCPKCEVRTCCINCIDIHKKELTCNGIRDKTEYISLQKFNDLVLLNDYRLLEEIGRSVNKFHKDPIKRYTIHGHLPVNLYRLKCAASRKGVTLHLMSENFSKRKNNTTYLNHKTNEIFWMIEWIFPLAENTKWIIKNAKESELVSDLLESILNPVENSIEEARKLKEMKNLNEKLKFYRAQSFSNLKVLLRAEKVANRNFRFYEMDVTESLVENLRQKQIIEYPTFYVISQDHSSMFEIIDSDVETEEQQPMENNEQLNRFKKQYPKKRKHEYNKRPEKREKLENVNFFFNGNDSDSDNESRNRKLNSKFNIQKYDDL